MYCVQCTLEFDSEVTTSWRNTNLSIIIIIIKCRAYVYVCGWQAASDEGFERATVGLAVCLVVTLLYATVATAVVVYDCRHKLRAARLKDEERQESLARTAAALKSRTATASAMKPTAGCTVVASRGPTVNGRQTAAGSGAAVRFTDEGSPPSNDISC